MAYRNLLPVCACIVILLTGTGCTVSRTSVKTGEDGWQTSRKYECDWGSRGTYLRRGDAPNSPILPVFRSRSRRFNPFAFPFDLVFSPIAYLTARDCRVVKTDRSYVGTKDNRRKEREAKARRERDEREARKRREAAETAARKAQDRKADAARKEREAEEKRRQEEIERLAKAYPPLEQSPRPMPVRSDDYALVVGIEDYRSIPKADYGENDAKLMKRYLEALGVPSANAVLLSGQGASKADLTKYLEEWLPRVVKPGSRVYFYYSGHGAPEPATGESYLVPWDGDPAFLKSTAYPLSKVYEQLASLPSRESVVLLDACFSGSGGRSVLAKGARPLVTVVETAPVSPEKTAVLSAAGPQEIAGGLELRGHGLFSYFLMRGLGGDADADRDGSLTLGELEGYVSEKVRETARRSNRDQTPRLTGDEDLKLY